jgi:4a-hydroxytetrahydrobiopterin dehydratase
MLVWLFKELSEYYGLMFGNVKAQSLGWIGALGVFLIAIAWIWALITSLLFYRSSILRGSTSLENFAAPPVQKLDVARVVLALTSVPGWKQQGDTIVRTFQFKDFPAAIQFVDAVAMLAEQAWHHPDIDIRWNKVTLTLSTHDAGGLTEKDFDLARKFDRLSPG